MNTPVPGGITRQLAASTRTEQHVFDVPSGSMLLDAALCRRSSRPFESKSESKRHIHPPGRPATTWAEHLLAPLPHRTFGHGPVGATVADKPPLAGRRLMPSAVQRSSVPTLAGNAIRRYAPGHFAAWTPRRGGERRAFDRQLPGRLHLPEEGHPSSGPDGMI